MRGCKAGRPHTRSSREMAWRARCHSSVAPGSSSRRFASRRASSTCASSPPVRRASAVEKAFCSLPPLGSSSHPPTCIVIPSFGARSPPCASAVLQPEFSPPRPSVSRMRQAAALQYATARVLHCGCQSGATGWCLLAILRGRQRMPCRRLCAARDAVDAVGRAAALRVAGDG